jgi:hypothetical protein
MEEGLMLQRVVARAEERRADAAFLRSYGIVPIDEDPECTTQDVSPEASQ